MEALQGQGSGEASSGMGVTEVRSAIGRIWTSEALKGFRRGFLIDAERILLELGDVCQACPARQRQTNRKGAALPGSEQVDAYRKRYFAILLHSYVGKAGSDEIDRLYSQLKTCEECWLGKPARGVSVRPRHEPE